MPLSEKLDAPSGDVERVHNALLNIKAICDRQVYEGRNNGTLDHIHGFAVAGLSALSAMPRQAGINEGLEMAAKERAAIVAWLHEEHKAIRAMQSSVRNLEDVATAIENGDHLKG